MMTTGMQVYGDKCEGLPVKPPEAGFAQMVHRLQTATDPAYRLLSVRTPWTRLSIAAPADQSCVPILQHLPAKRPAQRLEVTSHHPRRACDDLHANIACQPMGLLTCTLQPSTTNSCIFPIALLFQTSKTQPSLGHRKVKGKP